MDNYKGNTPLVPSEQCETRQHILRTRKVVTISLFYQMVPSLLESPQVHIKKVANLQ